jgi:hypothetical protein
MTEAQRDELSLTLARAVLALIDGVEVDTADRLVLRYMVWQSEQPDPSENAA